MHLGNVSILRILCLRAQSAVHPSWHLNLGNRNYFAELKVIHDMGTEGNHGLVSLAIREFSEFMPSFAKWAGTPGVGRLLNHFLNGGESRRQKIPKLILQVRAQILRATSPTPNSKCELQGARARRRGGRRALMVLREDRKR